MFCTCVPEVSCVKGDLVVFLSHVVDLLIQSLWAKGKTSGCQLNPFQFSCKEKVFIGLSFLFDPAWFNLLFG